MISNELQQIIHEITTTGQTLKEATQPRAPKKLGEAITPPVKYSSQDTPSVRYAKLAVNHLKAIIWQKRETGRAEDHQQLVDTLERQLLRIPNGQKLIDMNNTILSRMERGNWTERTDELRKIRDAAKVDDRAWREKMADQFRTGDNEYKPWWPERPESIWMDPDDDRRY